MVKMSVPFTTLRVQLLTASLVAFLLVVSLGLLNIGAARAGRSAVEATTRSYQRVALYGRLDAAATEFEAGVIEAASQQPGGKRAAQLGRARFAALLNAASQVSFETVAEDAARVRVLTQGRRLLNASSFSDVGAATRRLAAIERTGDPSAFAAEIARMRQPYDVFRHLLDTEIHTADADVSAASARAVAISSSLPTAAIFGLTAVLALTMAITLTLLRRLKFGLDRLETGARSLGAGMLSHRIALGGRDELTALSDAFDAMAAHLQSQQAALTDANANLEAAVAERTRDLSTANQSLAAEDRRRRTFLADVGHELRTPLTIIRGEAQIALRAADPNGVDHSPVYERILDQTHDLERLVDDLFLIARAEGGGLKLHLRRTDLGEIARRVAADFEALAAEEHASIRAPDSPPVEAEVDPDRVRQMIAALIDNALKHTRPGVAIEVFAETSPEGPRLAVRDNGPGVSPDLAESLFSRFRRGDSGGHGSGLGLAVVRALAEAHGGSASLENRPGGGACAWLRFPTLAGSV
jgi:signal transduction histidine kinase